MATNTTKNSRGPRKTFRRWRTLAREKVKTSVIARKLKRSVGATQLKAMRLGVTLGGGRRKKGLKAPRR